MDKIEFNNAMAALKAHTETKRVVSKGLEALCSDFTIIDFDYKFENAYIHLIELAMSDTSEWIDWFVYENDFGARGMEAGYDNALRPIATFDDLYILMAEDEMRKNITDNEERYSGIQNV